MSTITNALNVAGSIGGVARSVSNLAGLFGASAGSWKGALKTASYGGVKFGVEDDVVVAGRKTVVHDYPFRDDNWVEDIGKKSRRFAVSGFIVENDLITKGKGAVSQRDKLLAVCETEGAKTLIHPTLGTIKDVICIGIEIKESVSHGRVFEFRLTLIQTGRRQYPGAETTTTDAVTAQAELTGLAALADFASQVAGVIQDGASIVQDAISTAVGWYQFAVNVIGDVRRIIGSVSTLFGSFGNLFGGANTGFVKSNTKSNSAETAHDLLVQATVAKAKIASDGAALKAAAGSPSNITALAAAIKTLLSDMTASAINPADAVRMMSTMASYFPAKVAIAGQIGADINTMQTATASLFRRYALAQMATTLTTYQAASQNDAYTVLSAAVALFDAEITVAADAGDDGSYQALRQLKQTVVADMNSRGSDLRSIADFAFSSPLPSLVLANRIYRDPTREPGLDLQISPIHPAFCPTNFQALAV